MDKLSNDLILAIAERADAKSAVKLMQTNKRLHSTISSYQRSVAMTRIKSFTTLPSGKILSSEVYLRRPIQNSTFEMARELEKREARINDMLWYKTCVNLKSPPGLDTLTWGQQETLYILLKRAMWHCEYIADIAANAPCEPMIPQFYGRLKTRFFEMYDLPLGYRLQDPYTNYPARPFQIEYIRSLSTEDFLMLYYLLEILSSSFMRAQGVLFESDPSAAERIVVFAECVLRHGSWFSWAYLLGGDSWQPMTNAIQNVGLAELTSFELGEEDVMASLQSELSGRFRELHNLDEFVNPIKQLFKDVKRIVTGIDDEEEEMEAQAQA